MSLREHAIQELKLCGYKMDRTDDVEDQMVVHNVMELLDVFAAQGHSGTSAPWVLGIFSKLAAFMPLSPLQGTDDEWTEVAENLWQNKRCSHVFKEADGRAYDINGRVFIEPSGGGFTNADSKVYIWFPYTPKTDYVYLREDRKNEEDC